MKRSEVQSLILKESNIVQDKRYELAEALENLANATALLAESECDHPEFADHVCNHCGAYVEYSEEALQAIDDFNVLVADYSQGVYPDAAFESPYFQWPQERV